MMDGSRMVRFGRLQFKMAALPGKNFPKCLFSFETPRRRVDDLTVLHPNPPGYGALGDVQHGGTLRQAFQLDQIDQALALHPAETTFTINLPVQERFDAI